MSDLKHTERNPVIELSFKQLQNNVSRIEQQLQAAEPNWIQVSDDARSSIMELVSLLTAVIAQREQERFSETLQFLSQTQLKALSQLQHREDNHA